LGGDDFDQLIIDDCIKVLKLGDLTPTQIQKIKQFAIAIWASLNARLVSSSVRLINASDKDSNFDLLMRYEASIQLNSLLWLAVRRACH
jgi:molecular chaperone DnaK (HSP70)